MAVFRRLAALRTFMTPFPDATGLGRSPAPRLHGMEGVVGSNPIRSTRREVPYLAALARPSAVQLPATWLPGVSSSHTKSHTCWASVPFHLWLIGHNSEIERIQGRVAPPPV